MAKEPENNLMEKIVALCKRRGFVYQGSEIYGGLSGTWDYGPLGVALKKNIENLWWKRFVSDREDMYGVDAAILMNQEVWKASGHTTTFSDPLVECMKCKRRFRAGQLTDPKTCPDCKGKLGEARQFNMMFRTHIGATEDETAVSYLRPETAGGMFVNFKNVLDSLHPKLPFGLAQIGKAFRNEIAPRDFIFRVRELEQMEIEYFIPEKLWEEQFEYWRKEMLDWMKSIGLSSSKIHELEVAPEDRAHYSKRTIDFEFDFPFGRKELYGLAYRTDFDLASHSKASGVDLSYFDDETKERFVPHVIEPTFGVGRTMLALLCDAYTEDTLGEEPRVFLKLSPAVAPVKVAVFPLLKNKPVLVEKAREVFTMLKKEFGAVVFDDDGNIGKRYRRQDEIGTPFCITVDFDTVEKPARPDARLNDTVGQDTGRSGGDSSVTVRDRDSGKQERVPISGLVDFFRKALA